MPRASADKAYRNFAKGFITEATALTFPENSCRDIDNCDIELKGSLRRRLGLNEEAGGYSIGSGILRDYPASARLSGPFSILPVVGATVAKDEVAVTAHEWAAPGGRAELNFLVFQIGNVVIIRDANTDPVSDPAKISAQVAGATNFSIDGSTSGFVFKTSWDQAMKTPMQSGVGFNRIWFTSSALIPFYLEYDPITKLIGVHPVGYDSTNSNYQYGRLDIRDFNGVLDGLKNDERSPAPLSNEHKYNLFNQGWPDQKIYDYFISQNEYPSNAQQWILGKNGLNDFDPILLVKQDFGNSLAPRGRGIFNALSGDKTLVFPTIPISGAWNEPASASFSTVAFFAGRVWLSGDQNKSRGGGVYFSKTISKVQDAGQLMQENDPTSEHFSDLLATDGGVIYILEAANISKLVPFGAGILVMASNGIWFIYGGLGVGGFSADKYSVEKVSSTGILGPATVAVTDQSVVFFAENSIQIIGIEAQGGIPTIQDIGAQTIFSYYGAIDRRARIGAQACFDRISKKVFWSWLEVDEYDYPHLQSTYNRMLILDSRTGAFTKYSFAGDTTAFRMNGPSFPKRKISRPSGLEPVVVNGAPVVITGDPVVIIVNADVSNDFLNSVKILLLGSDGQGLHVGEFYDTEFVDYQLVSSFALSEYSSYVVTGDETLADLQRNKQATYVTSFFQRTETGYKIDSASNIVPKNPSGCLVRGRWDWHNTATGHRWSDYQVGYRSRRVSIPTSISDPLDTGEELVYTKLKIRGKGKALTLQYQSTPRKDFQLLGYTVSFTANGV